MWVNNWKTKHIKIDTEAMFQLNNSLLLEYRQGGDIDNRRAVWDDIVSHLPKQTNYLVDGSIT